MCDTGDNVVHGRTDEEYRAIVVRRSCGEVRKKVGRLVTGAMSPR